MEEEKIIPKEPEEVPEIDDCSCEPEKAETPQMPEEQPVNDAAEENIQPENTAVNEPVQNRPAAQGNMQNPGQPFQNYNPYDTNNQYTQFREYNRQYGQYAPQYQYVQQYQQSTPAKKGAAVPLNDSQKKIVTLLRISVILIALIFVYCIISDAVGYKSYENYKHSDSSVSETAPENEKSSNASEKSTVIYREGKPESAKNSDTETDENGKYTVQGIAAQVSPSIVQIAAYEDNSKGSTGSGIILNEEGYILTNAHVVSQFSNFEVELYGSEKTYKADLIGYDSKSDLAVVHIDAKGLIPAVIGDSDELNVGEEVVAIGNPAGLTSSVTSGIVSALDRQIRSGSTGFYMECIQTDAAISPGNSGGALVNMYGQVVGVTSSKYASAYYGGTYEGLGFAISINQAMPIAEELINKGYIGGRVKIGITFAALENEYVQAEFAAAFNLEECPFSEGIWITDISPECDIANTELAVNDVILSVNGTKVNNYDELLAVIEDCSAGDVLTAECRTFKTDSSGRIGSRDFTIEFELMEDTSGDY
ncbi:MAG: S1C family serine protease [Ruminococcus sp.]